MISVIVPVYNGADTIRRCIDSILSQTYKDIEIIIIDDASSDGTSEICEQYKKKENITIIHHNRNEGVSTSRNDGLNIARGEFISFCDVDDWFSTDMLETLITELLDSEADIVACGVNGLGHTEQSHAVYTNFDSMCRYVINDAGYIWNKLFRFSIIGEIRFDTDLWLCEDYLFLIKCMKNSKKMVTIPDRLYNYSYGGTSHGASNSHFRKGKFGYEIAMSRVQTVADSKDLKISFRHICYMTAVAERDSDFGHHILNAENRNILLNSIKRCRKGFIRNNYLTIRKRLYFTLRDIFPFLKYAASNFRHRRN